MMTSESESSSQCTKGILKPKHEINMNLGSYNLYVKRASFKDDGVLQQFVTEMAGQPVIAPPVLEQIIPIAADDGDSTELSEEEIAKRKAFERKRKEVAKPEGLDIKAVLGHRVSIPGAEDDDDDEESDDSNKVEQIQVPVVTKSQPKASEIPPKASAYPTSSSASASSSTQQKAE